MIDLQYRKEVIKFAKDTLVANVQDLKDIRNYIGQIFRVDFTEKNGEKFATKITRFDIMQTIQRKAWQKHFNQG